MKLRKKNHTKGSKINKNEIKRMRIEIQIKDKLEGNYKFFIGR
jgi:hypothetical protein